MNTIEGNDGSQQFLYQIDFNALSATGECVKKLYLTVPFADVKVLKSEKKKLVLERFCVEYARLNGVKCSYAEIISMTPTMKA